MENSRGQSPSRRPLGQELSQRRVPQAPIRRQRQLIGLDTLIKACYPIIYVSTGEEERFLRSLQDRYGLDRAVYQWTFTRGLVNRQDMRCVDQKTIGDPMVALRMVEKLEMSAIFAFCDLHPWLQDASSQMNTAVVRLLRDFYIAVRRDRTTDKSLLLVSPVLAIPPELEKEIVVFDFPLPDRDELRSLLDNHIHQAIRRSQAEIRLQPEDKEKLLEAALGLTLDEADNAFTAAILNDTVLDAADVRTILAEKQYIIRKSGILEYFPAEDSLDDVGGLEHLKKWLRKRSRAFTTEARKFGLPQPRGILLTGVQGCGKSLSAKAIANNWQLPLLRLDVGKVFNGLIGSSEENIRKALKLAEAMAPCILWIDELEKAFAGTHGSGAHDGGTTSRVFATFLTWMQEKKANVFVVATANQIDGLPPELMRKGRFDEIFFVDLPNENERRAIFGLHLAKRNRRPERFDLDTLAKATQGFSGAEIEQAVISGLFEAFDAGLDLGMPHLLDALRQTVPLSVTMREGIAGFREWAKTRAVPAS